MAFGSIARWILMQAFQTESFSATRYYGPIRVRLASLSKDLALYICRELQSQAVELFDMTGAGTSFETPVTHTLAFLTLLLRYPLPLMFHQIPISKMTQLAKRNC